MKFVIHHAETGAILRHGQCPAEDVGAQEVPDGHAVLALPDDHPAVDDTAHRVASGKIVARAPVAPTPEALLRRLRSRRNHDLAASDWTQLPDVPLSVAERAAWATYRQTLRDLPATTNDPASPVWPATPKRTEA